MFKAKNAKSVKYRAEMELASTKAVLERMRGGTLHANGELELNEADAELLRRLLAESHFQRTGEEIDELPFDGIVWSTNYLRNLAEFGRATGREQFKSAGMTEEMLAKFDALMNMLDATADAYEGYSIAYVYKELLNTARRFRSTIGDPPEGVDNHERRNDDSERSARGSLNPKLELIGRDLDPIIAAISVAPSSVETVSMPLSTYGGTEPSGFIYRLGKLLGGYSRVQIALGCVAIAVVVVPPILLFLIIVDGPNSRVSFAPTPVKTRDAKASVPALPTPTSTPVIANLVIPEPSATPVPKTERPKSGTIVSSGSRSGGYGQLYISNGTSNDALVRLIDVSVSKTYREVYIRANSAASITGIAAGYYDLLFATGQDYAPSIKKFLRNSEYSRFGSQLNYVETRTEGGISFKKFEVTLNAVAYGNTSVTKIDESAFDK